MLLKIEAYPSGTTLESWQPQPLHVCLATASNEGVAWAVGRKEGLVMFEKDKSVSRKDHCVFRFVSTTHEERAAACQTPEETDAVDPLHNLALVVENNGKLGTVLVHEPAMNENALDASSSSSKKNADDDSATTASAATAQEHAASQMSSGGAVLSPVGRQVLGAEQADRVRLEHLGTGSKRVLKPLRHEKGRMIVQCGKFGSTIIITRVETLSILRSGIPKREKFEHLDWFGAQELEEWRADQPISILVTNKKISNTKILSAWSQLKPSVTPSFFEAFVARTDPSDPLPQTQDFLAPGDHATFWNDKPNPQLLMGATFLSTKKGEDAELLVRCAGASIVQLFESDEPEQFVKELMDKGPCFALDVSRRKLVTLVKKLGVPVVTAKAIAKCVTEQDPGQIDEKLLSALEERKAALKQNDRASVLDETTDVNPPASIQSDPHRRQGDATEVSDDIALEESKNSSPSKSIQPNSHVSVDLSQSSNKRIRLDDTSQDIDDKDDTFSQRTKRARSLQQTSQWFGGDALSQSQADKLNSSADVEKAEEQNYSPTSDNVKDPPVHEKEATKLKKRSDNRPRLSSSGGWMQVAPKNDSQRKAMLRSDDEIQEIAGYEIMLPQAKTKKVAGLVGPAVGQNSFRRSKARDDVPDFKAFRKNKVAQIPPGGPSGTTAYRLRSVHHKDSAVEQNQYEEQRRALEEQQRRADALFRDSGTRTAAGRRRKQ